MRKKAFELFICAVIVPVSYTHLDVYKRQIIYSIPQWLLNVKFNVNFYATGGIRHSIIYNSRMRLLSGSYTHLRDTP